MNTYNQTELQCQALYKARAFLRNQVPTDMVAVAQVSEDLITLGQRALAQQGQPPTFPDSPGAIQQLAGAIDTLNRQMACNAGANDILTSTAAIASL